MDPYHIPANYTEAGRLLGYFEIRNTIEAAIAAIPLLFFSFAMLPVGITAKCIVGMILAIPSGGFALIGL